MCQGDVNPEAVPAARQFAIGSKNDVLQLTLAAVEQERAYLRNKLAAFEVYRESIRLLMPDTPDSTGPSETTEQLQGSLPQIGDECTRPRYGV